MHIFHGNGYAVGKEGGAYAALDYPALHRWIGTGICRNAQSRIRFWWQRFMALQRF